jgi:hypothetical protein
VDPIGAAVALPALAEWAQSAEADIRLALAVVEFTGAHLGDCGRRKHEAA